MFFAIAAVYGMQLWMLNGPPEPVDEPHIREAMVVTAQFRPQSEQDSVVRVTVFDQQEIRNRGAENLRELLQSELALNLSQHSVFGSGLAVNGLSGENVKVLVNGLPVTGRLDGIIDLEQINLGSFERVEFIEGPVSVYYGTDALAGVVNLISPAGSSKALAVTLNSHYRGLNDWHNRATADFAVGDNQFQVSLANRNNHGFDTEASSRNRDWPARTQDQVSWQWQRIFGASRLAYRGSAFDEEMSVLADLQQGNGWDQHYHTRRSHHQVQLESLSPGRWHWQWQVGYADYQRDRLSREITQGSFTGTATSDPAFANQFDLFQMKGIASYRGLLPGVDAQAGIDIVRETGSGGRLSGARTMNDRAFFGGLRWQNGGLTLQPMLRLTSHDTYTAPVTPSLHLKYAPNTRWDWRAAYSRGFRGPSMKQLFLDFSLAAGPFQYHIAGNEDLEAEKGHHYHSSLHTALAGWGDYRLHMESALYYTDVRNLIALSAALPDPAQPRLIRRHYINVDQQKSRGLRLNFQLDGRGQHLAMGIGRGDTANQFSRDHDLPKFNTQYTGRFIWRQAFLSERAHAAVTYKYNGSQPGFVASSARRGAPTEISEIKLPSYHQMDALLRWRFISQGVSLQAGVTNIFDVRNEQTVTVISGAAHEENHITWGRQISLQVTWQIGGRP